MFISCQMNQQYFIRQCGMEIEDGFERRKPRKVRVKVKTNRGLDFITAVRADTNISDLANRALSVYLELSEDGRLLPVKKQMTVSAVKQGIFYMPKSELVSNLLNNDDEVEVVIIKAKPKYPNQIFQNSQSSANPNKPPFSKPQIYPLIEQAKNKEQLYEVLAIEEQKEPADNVSCISKRQKKKQKKLQKQKIKQQAKYKQANQKVSQKQECTKKETSKEISILKYKTKNELPSEAKAAKEGDFNQEEAPRKRLKFDKEEVIEKVPPLIVPSPKITFHNQPRLQSPKFFLLGESSKKKWEGQVRKQSQDTQKRPQLEKIISPIQANRSPLIYQRSPSFTPHDSNKIKDKDELSGFTLSFRKLSEDKKIETKKQKTKDDIQSPKKQETKVSTKKKEDDKEQMIVQAEEKVAQQIVPKMQMEEKKPEPMKPKVNPSMIVVEQDDSDSEENKKSNGHVHHRQKQLSEIQQKINEFYIHSDEE